MVLWKMKGEEIINFLLTSFFDNLQRNVSDIDSVEQKGNRKHNWQHKSLGKRCA